MRQLSFKAVPVLFGACSFLFISCNREMYEYQVNIPWGGRIVALSRSPANDNDVIAAAQSGGLFMSTSGGNTWKHIQLPVFSMNDVKYSPTDRNVIIATSNKDLKAKNGGGIWHSSNGGKTWSHKLTSGSVSMYLNPSMNGYGISFEPGSRTVYAGTDYGVGVSTDNGLNWNFRVVAAEDTVVYSVLALGGGKVIATTAKAVYRSLDNGNTWTQVLTQTCTSARALAQIGSTGNHIVAAQKDYRLFYSNDSGQTWTEINSPMDRNRKQFYNREPFVRATSFRTTFFNAPVTVTQVFYGDGIYFHRKTIPNASAATLDFGNGWQRLFTDHDDLSEVIFRGNGEPYLLAGDGGILSTTDQGANWTMSGNSANGLNALQINEANAQEYYDLNEKRTYVYFGTQDNNLWASPNDGLTWTSTGNEGHSIQTKRRATLPQGNLMTYALDDSSQYYRSEQGFVDVQDWTEPGKKAGDAIILPPYDILDPTPQDRFLQMAYTTKKISFGTGLFFTKTFYRFHQTADGGSTWKMLDTLFNPPTSQYPKAGFKNEPVVYQCYSMPKPAANGWGRIGLVRLSGLGNSPGQSVVQQADLNDFGGIGIMPTEFLWYNVFAVDPSNPDHALIADVIDNVVKTTYDGGKNWYAENSLTDIITNSGAFKMSDWGGISLVTHISFNPDDPKQIAIGTRENGIFFTWNGGQRWYQLKNTTHITNVSSITFYFDKTLLVSTYGRGLWKVEPKKSNVFTRNPRIPFSDGVWEWDAINGSIDRPGGKDAGTGDMMIEVDSSRHMMLPQIFSRPGEFIELGQLRLQIPRLSETAQKRMREIDQVPVRAIRYNREHIITGAVVGYASYKVYRPEDITVTERNEPRIEFYSREGEPVNRMNAEDTIIVQGIYFSPGKKVAIFVNDRFYREAVAGADSSFQIELRPPNGEKRLKITVTEGENRNDILTVREIPVVIGEDELKKQERKQ